VGRRCSWRGVETVFQTSCEVVVLDLRRQRHTKVCDQWWMGPCGTKAFDREKGWVELSTIESWCNFRCRCIEETSDQGGLMLI
jgi:hypothetical protein